MVQSFDQLACERVRSRGEVIRLLVEVRRGGGSDDVESRALEQVGFWGAAGLCERYQTVC